MKTSFESDILVVGGGPSGIGAAFAAAKLGQKVIILERNGYLGGVATSGSMSSLINRKAHDKYNLAGSIYKEIIEILKKRKDAIFQSDVCDFVDIEQYKLLLDEMGKKLNVKVFFHSWGFETIKETPNKISGLRALTRQGVLDFHAPLIIDATGDASIAKNAGAEVETIEAPQPMTMTIKIGNVDLKKAFSAGVHSARPDGKDVVIAGVKKYFDKARSDGNLSIPRNDIAMGWSNPANPSEVVINGTRVLHKHNLNAEEISNAESEGRRQALELFEVFKKYIPGYENSFLASTGPEIGVREGGRLLGQYRLSKDDVLKMREFDDAIAACSYAIDVHSPDGSNTEFIEIHNQGKGFYEIPFSCCLPRNISGMLVVGRGISADTAAAGSFRVMPSVMTIGQGAIEFALTGTSSNPLPKTN